MLYYNNALTKWITATESSHDYSHVDASKDMLKLLKNGLTGLLRNGYMSSEQQNSWDGLMINLSDIIDAHKRLKAEAL